MENNSYWIESTKDKKKYPKLKENIETDICIIGGGLTGLTTAYYLINSGKKVILVEKDEICSKTSGNTTGKITSQHGIFYNYLVNSEDEEFAKKYYECNEQAIKNIEEIIKNEKIDCDFERQDNYVYTNSEEELINIKEEFDTLKRIGADVELIRKLDKNKKEPNLDILAAIKLKNQAQFNSRKYAVGLADKVSSKGINIYENTKIIDIKKKNNGYIVKSNDCEITTKYIVLACGYPIIKFPGLYFIKMYQETSYAIAVDIKEEVFNGMYISKESPVFSLRNIDIGNNKLVAVIGAEHKTGDNNDVESSYKILEKWIKEKYPKAEVKYRWNTEDTISLDKIPYIGSFSDSMPHIYVATGFKKWGITSSNIAASIITDMILKRENPYKDIFYSKRLKPIKNHEELSNMVKEATSGMLINKLKVSKSKLEDVKKQEGKIVQIDGEDVGVYRDEENNLYGVSPICTHMGCLLSFNNLEKTWDCPCHGSRFSYAGKCLYAPSVKDLKCIEISDNEDNNI